MTTSPGRDVVVIAASAGGLGALQRLIAELPYALPASLSVVLHIPATGGRSLRKILDRAGPLRAPPPIDGAALRHGHVYVAPADHHLLLAHDHLRICRGPRQNGHRPAADPLFVSAATMGGSRVLGVVLSGMLDDAAAGSAVIERYGGSVVVQDPDEAEYDGMPTAALAATEHALALSIDEIAAHIAEQSHMPIERTRFHPDAEDVRYVDAMMTTADPGPTPDADWTGMTCPECGGPLREVPSGPPQRFECRVGHVWSPASLLDGQSTAVERALWVGTVRLDERARLMRRMADEAKGHGRALSAGQFLEAAAEAEEVAATLRGLIEAFASHEDAEIDIDSGEAV